VATPGILVKLLQRLYDPGPQRIKMDVPYQREQVPVFFTEYGFIAVLK
jgi:hypothetical protein